MLKAMRTGAKSVVIKIALFGMLLMAMLGLAVLDINGMFRRGVGHTTLANVGKDKITTTEFQRIVSTNLQRQNIPLSEAVKNGLPAQILGAEVNGRMHDQAARDLGLAVDDRTAAKAVKALVSSLTKTGLSEKDALNRVLVSSGLSEDQLVAGIKSEIAANTMLDLLKSNAIVPAQLLQDATRFRNEERKAAFITLTLSDLGSAPAPSDAELKAYYDTSAADYAMPERRSFSAVLLNAETLGLAKAGTSDADLRAYYNAHKDAFSTPEKRTVEQAVVKDESAAKDLIAKAGKQGLQKAATESKITYIKEQTVSPKDIDIDLATAAFKAKEGQFVQVASPLGHHVIHVTKIMPGTVKPFDAVRSDIVKELSRDQNSEALYNKTNEIDDMIAGGKTLPEVAEKFGLKVVNFNNIDAAGFDEKGIKASAPLPAFDKALSEAFSLQKNEASQLIETPGGDFVIVETHEISPPQNKPYEQVKDKVHARWIAEKETGLFQEKIDSITERLKKDESVDAIAQSFKKQVQTTGYLARGKADTALSAQAVAALFSLSPETSALAIQDGQKIVVLKLAEQRVVDKKPSAEDVAALNQMLATSLQNDIADQYRAHLVREYNVTINERLLQDMFTSKEETP